MPFRKWTSIKRFSDVYASAQRYGTETVAYRAKIKLHGTNAAIRVDNEAFIAQRRTSDISLTDDNAGFAAWVNAIDTTPLSDLDNGIIFYGEWAGPGIQSSDAVTKLKTKKFFVFTVLILNNDAEKWIVEPDEIAEYVAAYFNDNEDIIVLPWYTDTINVNFMDQNSAQEFITSATSIVDTVIAVQDPYIEEMFGIEGPGEGLVYYADVEDDLKSAYMFKVKSEVHSVNQSKKRDHVAPEKPEGVDDFISMFFTEARFNQILSEKLGGSRDRRETGTFIKEVMSDVHKESKNEIALADFEWKTVVKFAVPVVKSWFFKPTF